MHAQGDFQPEFDIRLRIAVVTVRMFISCVRSKIPGRDLPVG